MHFGSFFSIVSVVAIDLILNPMYADHYLAMNSLHSDVDENKNRAYVTLHVSSTEEIELNVRYLFGQFEYEYILTMWFSGNKVQTFRTDSFHSIGFG